MSETAEKTGREILTSMSHQDFLSFGMQDMAYVKTVEIKGKELHGVFSADGQLMEFFQHPAELFGAVINENLDILSVH